MSHRQQPGQRQQEEEGRRRDQKQGREGKDRPRG